ncbi:MAG: hypothetical protein HOM80_02300 [Bacteroidetes bacterium]|jgi:hypothetical protein|nr:hypothetical protein [Bacteroidota bacterium]
MDNRIENTTEKIELLISNSQKLQTSMSKLFKKVDNTQTKLDGKLKKTNSDIDKVLNEFKDDSQKLIDNVNKIVDEKKLDIESSINDVKSQIITIQKKYEKNVNELISSIDTKSNEILEIYNELESIKSIQKKALEKSNKFEIDGQKMLEDFKKHDKEVFDNSNIEGLKKKVNSFESRMRKMEKYAHKHTFGGTKI